MATLLPSLLSTPTQSAPATTSTTLASSLLIDAKMLQADNLGSVGVGGDSVGTTGGAAGVNGNVINQSFAFHLLHNEKIYMNLTQVLNISAENLTTLLITVQNGTSSDLLEQQLLPDNGTPMTLLATLTICYALIFVAGVLGNLITCIVISRNNFMHTATNFYLFNLAISDLILLLSGVPQELYNLWNPDSYPFTDVICIIRSVLAETAANATVLTITAFTVERYIAICHPFRQHTMSKLSRAIKFIFAIWLMALLLALPQAIQFSVMPEDGGYSCTMENDFYAHVFAVSGFIFFGGPMTAICVLYVLIGVKLKRSRLLQTMPRRSYDINRSLNAQSRVIRMLVAVAVAFFFCWAPFHAQRLMAVYGLSLINIGINREDFYDYFRILDYTSGVLYFLSTCINPLLYNIMSHKFREAFKITLTRQFGLSGKQQTQHHNYSALLRQNGSMRLHTTVNNNALEHFGSSYRVVQFRCRDPSHQFSLQDSIRTTTTTTTISTSMSLGGAGGSKSTFSGASVGSASSCRSSHRNCCVAIGAKGDISSSVGRINANTNIVLPAHRLLQRHISQLSSMGDVHSLHESDMGQKYQTSGTSYRAKRALLATCSGTKTADCTANTADGPTSGNNNATTSATHILHASQPTSSRLKLSRIITRRENEAYPSCRNPNTRVELVHKPLPIVGDDAVDDDAVGLHVVPTRSIANKTIENIAEKLHLKRHNTRKSKSKRKQRQKPTKSQSACTEETKPETQIEHEIDATTTALVANKNLDALMSLKLPAAEPVMCGGVATSHGSRNSL